MEVCANLGWEDRGGFRNKLEICLYQRGAWGLYPL
jgi:hypothetical protein